MQDDEKIGLQNCYITGLHGRYLQVFLQRSAQPKKHLWLQQNFYEQLMLVRQQWI